MKMIFSFGRIPTCNNSNMKTCKNHRYSNRDNSNNILLVAALTTPAATPTTVIAMTMPTIERAMEAFLRRMAPRISPAAAELCPTTASKTKKYVLVQ